MLFPWVVLLFIAQAGEGAGDAASGGPGLDHFVDKTALGGDEGIGKAHLVIAGQFGHAVAVVQLIAVQDADRAARPHDRDFRRGPGIVQIAPQMFRRHHDIGPAIRFAGDQRDLGHRRLAVSEGEFRAVVDDAAPFLFGPRQKARHVDQRQNGDGKRIAKPHEPRRLARAVDVQTPRQHHRLIGDDADGLAFHTDKAAQDIAGEIALDLEEIGLVGQFQDQFAHVVRGVRVVGDQRVQTVLDPQGIIEEGPHRRGFAVRQRQEIEQAADFRQRLDIIVERPIGHAGFLRMGISAAQFIRRHHLIGDGFQHIRPGHEHVRRAAHHEGEVGDGRRIDRAARRWSHDHRNLRDHPRGQDIALKHLRIADQTGHTFLNARAARIVQPDQRRAILDRHIHDLADLLRMGFRKRAAKHGKILRIDINHAPIDRAPAGHHAITRRAVAVHAEFGRTVGDEHIEFLETVVVQQQFQPLTRGQLAACVLGVDAFLPAAQPGRLPALFQLVQNIAHIPPLGLALALISGSLTESRRRHKRARP